MRIGTIGLGAAAAFAGFLCVQAAGNGVDTEETSRRTVVVYDGGQKRVVKTDAATVGELLGKIDAELSIGDKVAPDLGEAIDGNLYYVNVWRATPVVILEWADSRTAQAYGQSGQPFGAHLYDVVQGDEDDEEESEAGGGSGGGSVNKSWKANLSALKIQWLTAAGIAEEDWVYVDHIVFKESSWNPNAINRSSGACGLAQALPCSKVPGNPFDPVDSLKWQKNYVTTRYGGYAKAYAFWQKNRWY